MQHIVTLVRDIDMQELIEHHVSYQCSSSIMYFQALLQRKDFVDFPLTTVVTCQIE